MSTARKRAGGRAALLTAVSLGLGAAPARADDEPEPLSSSVGAEVDGGYRKPKKGIDALFGRPGEVVITGDFSLSFSSTSTDNPAGTPQSIQSSGASTTVVVGPSVDVFVARNISLGAALFLAHTSLDASSSTSVGFGPRLGFNIPLAESASLWIRAGGSYRRTSYSFPETPDGAGPSSFSGATFSLVAAAPLEIHLAPHFFVGFGPAASTDVSARLSAGDQSIDGPKQTSYRVQTEVGGFF